MTYEVRFHSSDDIDDRSEFKEVTEPVAVVVRPDGSLDVYGYIGVVDQRPDPVDVYRHTGYCAWCDEAESPTYMAHEGHDPECPFSESPGNLATPDEWQELTGIRILDPDGWRGKGDPPWSQPIDRAEFLRRAEVCTVRSWPSPLWDETE